MKAFDFKRELEDIAKEAGEILLSYFLKPLNKKSKKAGYATEADLASEDFLIKSLTSLLPEASFWAEESGQSGKNNSEYRWVIDPLDGTTNFTQGIPYFCLSIALTQKDEPIVGLIYNPITKELFYAQKDKGAFLNGNKISVSNKENLKDCFFGTSIPYPGGKKFAKFWRTVVAVRKRSFTLRLMGAAALDQAYVACGRFDGTFFNTLSWWDIAAGIILIKEAGGIVTDYSGNQIGPDFTSFIAASRPIHTELLKIIQY